MPQQDLPVSCRMCDKVLKATFEKNDDAFIVKDKKGNWTMWECYPCYSGRVLKGIENRHSYREKLR